MKRSTMIIVISSAMLVLLSAGTYVLYSASGNSEQGSSMSGLITNNSYINGLYNDIDLNDTRAVFRYVFSNLEDEVTIYPSENYYYFKFTAAGKTISGSLSFPVERIDRGLVGLGYSVKPEDRSRQKYFRIKGGYHDFSEDDGLIVKRITGFRYQLTFEGKTVIFNLYDKLEPPKKARLMADEVFVGPSFNESGMQFFLIFNKTVNKLYWVLNEDGFVADDFSRVTDNVVMGDRTEFAFYVDSANNRKILVGVQGMNVLHNNWFDGPFDQMPDNFVRAGKIDVKTYIDKHYAFSDDKIDRYGKFKARDNSRVPVAPYSVYFDQKELQFVDSLKTIDAPASEFIAEITRQLYKIPDDYYDGVIAK